MVGEKRNLDSRFESEEAIAGTQNFESNPLILDEIIPSNPLLCEMEPLGVLSPWIDANKRFRLQ
jgi:hypothetical protein